MNAKQQKEYDALTAEQVIIYDSIMYFFPATKHDTAYDIALQGGVRWNYNFR